MLIDRMTQKTVKDKNIISPFDATRYKASSDLAINGHSIISAGDILAEDGTGRFKCDVLNLVCRKSEDDEDQLLVELALLQIDEQLSFSSEVLPSPLLPSRLFDEEGDLNELEFLLEGVLSKGHLHEISRRPRFDMRYDEIVLPVSRAKRLASSAERHLAAHSECWQRRTLTGIQPRKIKGLVSEDEFHLYENRVYVRLLDRLEIFLAKRMREIDALTKNLTDALDIEGSDKINYRLSRKLFSIWGETFHTDTAALDALERLEGTQEVLRKQYQSIRGLIQHKFYRKIPKSAQIAGQIEQTNILSHDQHYRYLPKLWNTLRKQNHSENLTPQETLERNSALQKAYLNYCSLIILRAFKGLGFELFPRDSGNYYLERNEKKITLSTDGSHWDIRCHQSETVIRLVPIFSWTLQPIKSFKDNGVLTIPCCLKSETNVSHPSDWINRNSSSPMTLSPLDFYVEEKMTSLLNLWIIKNSVKSYGEEISLIPKSVLLMMKNIPEFEVRSSNSCALSSLPSKAELKEIENVLIEQNARKSLCQLKERVNTLHELSHCPCCQSSAKFTPRDNSCFIAQCQNHDCQTEWEVSNVDGSRVFKMGTAEVGCNEFKISGRWSGWITLT